MNQLFFDYALDFVELASLRNFLYPMRKISGFSDVNCKFYL